MKYKRKRNAPESKEKKTLIKNYCNQCKDSFNKNILDKEDSGKDRIIENSKVYCRNLDAERVIAKGSAKNQHAENADLTLNEIVNRVHVENQDMQKNAAKKILTKKILKI